MNSDLIYKSHQTTWLEVQQKLKKGREEKGRKKKERKKGNKNRNHSDKNEQERKGNNYDK